MSHYLYGFSHSWMLGSLLLSFILECEQPSRIPQIYMNRYLYLVGKCVVLILSIINHFLWAHFVWSSSQSQWMTPSHKKVIMRSLPDLLLRNGLSGQHAFRLVASCRLHPNLPVIKLRSACVTHPAVQLPSVIIRFTGEGQGCNCRVNLLPTGLSCLPPIHSQGSTARVPRIHP